MLRANSLCGSYSVDSHPRFAQLDNLFAIVLRQRQRDLQARDSLFLIGIYIFADLRHLMHQLVHARYNPFGGVKIHFIAWLLYHSSRT